MGAVVLSQDTIVALSSGHGRAALAIVRLSGSRVRFVVETFIGTTLEHRIARLVTFRRPCDGAVIDRCVAIYFAAPKSFTGEDVLELHLHGSVAVVAAALQGLTAVSGVRLAEPGEFSRRALENGKLDLLQVEALGDLLNAETSGQLAQAQRQLSGELGRRAGLWREQLIGMRAVLEAELDFSDEGDVGDGLVAGIRSSISSLLEDVSAVLGAADKGRRIRDGSTVAIVGAPNAGKSTLLNALAGRDVAIVSPVPGTTRDLVEAAMDLEGWPVVFVDTAGIREATDAIEREGVARAQHLARRADLVLSVFSADVPAVDVRLDADIPVLRVGTKSDLAVADGSDVAVSGLDGSGLAELRNAILAVLRGATVQEEPLVSRARQQQVLVSVVSGLQRALEVSAAELVAEELRHASFALGSLVGQTDLETVLDSLFQGFCIGK